MKKLISASLLAADRFNLDKELKRVEDNNIDLIHFDVMDNVFVPNTSFNDDTFKKIRHLSNIPFEIHLMVDNPFAYIDNYDYSSDDVIIVHYESFKNKEDLNVCLRRIKKHHKVGLSIKPMTSVEKILPYLDILDYVLVMSVEPGFGGQKFMDAALEKIYDLVQYRNDRKYLIEVDGGINESTSKACFEAGADILVSGSYLFEGDMKSKKESLLK